MSSETVVDVLVVGSGAGGMTAAITAHDEGLQALVIEKSEQFGGTTAMSGGVIWVPDNHLMKQVGIDDSPEEAMQYLKATTAGEVPEVKLKSYIENSPKMLKYLEENTQTRFNPAPEYSDYYPGLPGYKRGSRSLDPAPFSHRKMKQHGDEIRLPNGRPLFGIIHLTAIEAHAIMQSNLARAKFIIWRVLMHFLDIPYRLKGKRNNRLTLGQALCASLRASMLDRNLPLWLNTSLEELLIEEGKVVGARVIKEGQPHTIKARKGVVMATGGFARNVEMREKYQKSPIGDQWTNVNPHDMGEGIQAGEKVGAQLEFMHCAWWTPTVVLPGSKAEALIVGKSLPGCIFVNKSGERFTNEAAPYEDVVKAQYASDDKTPSIPCYMVFDATYREEYPIANGRLMPSKVVPDEKIPQEYVDFKFLKKAQTIRQLADVINVDADGLEATIKQFNQFAESGVDEDYGRGSNAQDCYYSDPNTGFPNPTLSPIARPPFYAIEIWPGDLGTKGGLKTDEYGRVLDTSGNVIAGLYATGNCAGSVMGNSYPGAGSTIGPAMTFGWVAARYMAGKQ